MAINEEDNPERNDITAGEPSGISISLDNVVGDTIENSNHIHSADEEEAGCSDNNEDDDDDDVTIILLDHNSDDQAQQYAMDWIEQTGPEMEERRRTVLLAELRRVQRASFFHFALLCLIPAALLAIVIATVFGDEADCASEATFCQLEPRTFVNAFTTRCVCDPIPVSHNDLSSNGI